MTHPTPPDRRRPPPEEQSPTAPPRFDEVEEAGRESFPASDPPSWTDTHSGAPRTGERPGDADEEPRA